MKLSEQVMFHLKTKTQNDQEIFQSTVHRVINLSNLFRFHILKTAEIASGSLLYSKIINTMAMWAHA